MALAIRLIEIEVPTSAEAISNMVFIIFIFVPFVFVLKNLIKNWTITTKTVKEMSKTHSRI
jgi:hypothetical protein